MTCFPIPCFPEEGKSDLSLPATPILLGALLVDSFRYSGLCFPWNVGFFMDKSTDKLPSDHSTNK